MPDYRPDPTGAWLAAVRADTLLVLPADRADDVAALWPVLRSTDAAAHVIDRLTAAGVTSAPGFALVVRERASGSVRAVVRGPLSVRVGDDEVSGAGVSTWSERAFDGSPVVRVSADAGGDGPADAAALRLPIVEGVVAASVVEWAVETAPAVPVPAPTAAAVRVPEPVPVPVPEAAASDRPDERTMVPDEDTVVGFSRTERPRIAVAGGRDALPDRGAAAGAAPVASTTTIVPPPELSERPATALGDHDGLTVASADIRRLREERGAERGASPTGDASRGDDRLALRLPDGSFEPITGELVLGRAPAIGRVSGARVPRPVVIGAGDPDISRTHLRVAVEGGTAVVTDLESRNGTQVVAPGQPPMRLRPSEPTPVLPETVIDLGGGWTIQVVVR